MNFIYGPLHSVWNPDSKRFPSKFRIPYLQRNTLFRKQGWFVWSRRGLVGFFKKAWMSSRFKSLEHVGQVISPTHGFNFSKKAWMPSRFMGLEHVRQVISPTYGFNFYVPVISSSASFIYNTGRIIHFLLHLGLTFFYYNRIRI